MSFSGGVPGAPSPSQEPGRPRPSLHGFRFGMRGKLWEGGRRCLAPQNETLTLGFQTTEEGGFRKGGPLSRPPPSPGTPVSIPDKPPLPTERKADPRREEGIRVWTHRAVTALGHPHWSPLHRRPQAGLILSLCRNALDNSCLKVFMNTAASRAVPAISLGSTQAASPETPTAARETSVRPKEDRRGGTQEDLVTDKL